MNLIPIIKRIRSECPSFPDAQLAVSVISIDDNNAYVAPVRDLVLQDNSRLSAIHQIIESRFAVMFAALVGDIATEDEPLERRRAEIREALLGTRSQDWPYAIKYAGGEVIEMRNGRVSWQEIYSAGYPVSADITDV